MQRPLISVVIPTCGRPQFLPAAVASALENMDDEVEVIVVPNGADESWKQSLTSFFKDSRVRIEPIAKAHANAARNYGLCLSHGKYIRFLDDDDILFPTAAVEQLRVIQDSGAEICSGSVRRVIENGDADLMEQQDDNDLLCAMVKPARVCLPVAHVFLKEKISNLLWDESLPWEQDTAWVMKLCSTKEWDWKSISVTVGQWNHHGSRRTSNTVSQFQRAKFTTTIFLDTLASVRHRSNLSDKRKDAFSEAFWHYAHSHFFRDPIFWTHIARIAMSLRPARKPPDPFYELPIINKINPLLFEYLLIPDRFIREQFRLLKRKSF